MLPRLKRVTCATSACLSPDAPDACSHRGADLLAGRVAFVSSLQALALEVWAHLKTELLGYPAA